MLIRYKAFSHWFHLCPSWNPCWLEPGASFSYLQDTYIWNRHVLGKLSLLGPCCILSFTLPAVWLHCSAPWCVYPFPLPSAPCVSMQLQPWSTGTPGLCLTLHRAELATWPVLVTNALHAFYRYSSLWWPKLCLDPEALLLWHSRTTAHAVVRVRKCTDQEHWAGKECLQYQELAKSAALVSGILSQTLAVCSTSMTSKAPIIKDIKT